MAAAGAHDDGSLAPSEPRREHWRGKTYRYVENAFYPYRVTVGLWDAQGQYRQVPGDVLLPHFRWGAALIGIDPQGLGLHPVPFGDSESVRVGQRLVALDRGLLNLSSVAGKVTRLYREPYYDGSGKKFIAGLHISGLPRSYHLETYSNDSHIVADKPGKLRSPGRSLGAPLIDESGHPVAVVGPEGWPVARGQQ